MRELRDNDMKLVQKERELRDKVGDMELRDKVGDMKHGWSRKRGN